MMTSRITSKVLKDKHALETQILSCCVNGDLTTLRILIATPFKTSNGKEEVLKVLNLNQPLAINKIALHVATEQNHLSVVQYLINSCKLYVDARNEVSDC